MLNRLVLGLMATALLATPAHAQPSGTAYAPLKESIIQDNFFITLQVRCGTGRAMVDGTEAGFAFSDETKALPYRDKTYVQNWSVEGTNRAADLHDKDPARACSLLTDAARERVFLLAHRQRMFLDPAFRGAAR